MVKSIKSVVIYQDTNGEFAVYKVSVIDIKLAYTGRNTGSNS